jgi:hypothetical protein
MSQAVRGCIELNVSCGNWNLTNFTISFVFLGLSRILIVICLLLMLLFVIGSFFVVKVIIVIVWVLGKHKYFPFSFLIVLMVLFYLMIVVIIEHNSLLVIERSLLAWTDCKLLIWRGLPWLLLWEGLKLLMIECTGGICRGWSVCVIHSLLLLFFFVTQKSL